MVQLNPSCPSGQENHSGDEQFPGRELNVIGFTEQYFFKEKKQSPVIYNIYIYIYIYIYIIYIYIIYIYIYETYALGALCSYMWLSSRLYMALKQCSRLYYVYQSMLLHTKD